MKQATILCVDDEPNVLSSIRRNLQREFNVLTAISGLEALNTLRAHNDIEVVVSDMSMPGMDGAQLLKYYKEYSPDTVRIMLTGNADQATATKAINDGQIFRFLSKPCPPKTLGKAISDGVNHHRLITSERELLEKTFKGTLKLLTDVLAIAAPDVFSAGTELQNIAKKVTKELGINDGWILEAAIMLLQLGWVGVPLELVKAYRSQGEISTNDQVLIDDRWKTAHSLIQNIPRLEVVADIIEFGHKREAELDSELLPLGKAMQVLVSYAERIHIGDSPVDAIVKIEEIGSYFDPEVVAVIRRINEDAADYAVAEVDIRGLVIGQVFMRDVLGTDGQVLLRKGQVVTDSLRTRLGNYYSIGRLDGKFLVKIDDSKHLAS